MEHTRLVAQLAALAHPTRLKAFRLLVRAGPEGLASGAIALRLKIPPTTMSTHLGILARAGLITAARDSRVIRYALAVQQVRALLSTLMDDCCGGRPELCAPPSTQRSQQGQAALKPARRRAP